MNASVDSLPLALLFNEHRYPNDNLDEQQGDKHRVLHKSATLKSLNLIYVGIRY